MVIMLCGGVGAGKSAALSYLKEAYDAEIIGSDDTAHELYETGREGWQAVIRLLGDGVRNEDGSLDRKKMADMLYKDPGLLEKLDEKIHPLVCAELRRKVKASAKKLIIIETALPQKAESDIFDEVWYVYTPVDVRIRRLAKNRGYTEERAREIMARQPSEKTYWEMADFVLDNSGSPGELRAQIDARIAGMRFEESVRQGAGHGRKNQKEERSGIMKQQGRKR